MEHVTDRKGEEGLDKLWIDWLNEDMNEKGVNIGMSGDIEQWER